MPFVGHADLRFEPLPARAVEPPALRDLWELRPTWPAAFSAAAASVCVVVMDGSAWLGGLGVLTMPLRATANWSLSALRWCGASAHPARSDGAVGRRGARLGTLESDARKRRLVGLEHGLALAVERHLACRTRHLAVAAGAARTAHRCPDTGPGRSGCVQCGCIQERADAGGTSCGSPCRATVGDVRNRPDADGVDGPSHGAVRLRCRMAEGPFDTGASRWGGLAGGRGGTRPQTVMNSDQRRREESIRFARSAAIRSWRPADLDHAAPRKRAPQPSWCFRADRPGHRQPENLD